MHLFPTRPRALAAVGAVTLAASLVMSGSPAIAKPASHYPAPSAANGATYLVHRLAAGGGHLSTTFDGTAYPDYGLTLDSVLALDAAKAGQAAAAKATTYVAKNVGSYIGTGGESYAGATAKTLVAAVAEHRLSHERFGGVNLVTRLQALLTKSGQYKDKSQYGDYSNTFSQALAIVGLKMAGHPAPAKAGAFLRLQQCPAGGFRLALGAKKCTSNASADPDSTALALQGLVALPASHARTVAIRAAGGYLVRHQAKSGGLGGGTTTTAVNTNSTGLATLSLKSAHRTGAMRKGAAYLKSMQYGCRFPSSLRGGFAYDASARAATAKAGKGAKPSDQDTRATTQVLLGLAGINLVSLTDKGATSGAPAYRC